MVISCYVQHPCENTPYLPFPIRITSPLTRYRQRTALWKKPPTTPRERTSLDSSKCLSVCLSICLSVCPSVCLPVVILFAAVTISSMLHRETAIHFHNKKKLEDRSDHSWILMWRDLGENWSFSLVLCSPCCKIILLWEALVDESHVRCLNYSLFCLLCRTNAGQEFLFQAKDEVCIQWVVLIGHTLGFHPQT